MHITKDNINEFIEGTTMDCSYKVITHIEYIPDGITRLYCQYNELTSLPKLPENLLSLYCDNNKLTKLPNLPHRLRYFDCSFNNLPYKVTLKNLKEHNKLIKRKEIISKICI